MTRKEDAIQEALDMLNTGSSIEQALGRIAYMYGQVAREAVAKEFRLSILRDRKEVAA